MKWVEPDSQLAKLTAHDRTS